MQEPTTSLSPASVEAIGYVGGFVLALCLVPQIRQVVVTQSAADISYTWTALYLIGLSITLAYLVLVGAVAGYVSVTIEMVLLIVLVVFKAWIDRKNSKKREATAATKADDDEGHDDAEAAVPLSE
ncbi:hypothetical protein BC828DRAFT_406590 [Blastocladiella britannica]|nr:hypothetical protein BC828DRAFT_406590 [Blastocladiella britannica]